VYDREHAVAGTAATATKSANPRNFERFFDRMIHPHLETGSIGAFSAHFSASRKAWVMPCTPNWH
jgi:hypothetical protein